MSKEQQEQREQTIRQRISTLNTEERVLNILIGAVTGTGGAAVSQAALSQAADQMRQLMDVDSKKFAGVTDGITVLGNMTGDSAGVRGDGLKIGGTRVDLDLLCGRSNERCITNAKGELVLNEFGYVRFEPEAVGVKTIQEFIKNHPNGKDMVGTAGGIQGMKGTLLGWSYAEDSWQDHLVEAFSGSHDMIGGQLSGLYDEQGNARRGRSVVTKALHNRWSQVAIPIAAPFAAAELLPPEVWKAISILLTGGK